jgi:uncharacterized membrane protein
MSPEVESWMNLVFRWLHVVAGVMWIGHLWFFNFVNAQVAKTYDGDSKKKVVPELMPRALYWFRWGAAYTFITGVLLLGLVIYMPSGVMSRVIQQSTSADQPVLSTGLGTAIGLGLLVVAFLIYDVMWKAMAKQEMAGMAVSFALVVGVAFGLAQVYSGRAVLIHIGAMFGTIMAANVWMRIWPNQRRIIAAIKDGKAPDAAWVGLAGLRSKHNTYMSIPLIAFMISSHYSTILYGTSNDPMIVPGVVGGTVAVGWLLAKFFFNKSAGKAPTEFLPADYTPAAAPAAAAGDKK